MARRPYQVGSKPTCCYIKIKPGDNNTAYLQFAHAGRLYGEKVYDAPGDAEDDVGALGVENGSQAICLKPARAAAIDRIFF